MGPDARNDRIEGFDGRSLRAVLTSGNPLGYPCTVIPCLAGSPMVIGSLRKSILAVAVTTGVLLLVPAVAMQFTREVNWGLADFLVAGGLLFGAGMTYVVTARLARRPGQRAALAAAVLLGLAVVWAELAVGLFR